MSLGEIRLLVSTFYGKILVCPLFIVPGDATDYLAFCRDITDFLFNTGEYA